MRNFKGSWERLEQINNVLCHIEKKPKLLEMSFRQIVYYLKRSLKKTEPQAIRLAAQIRSLVNGGIHPDDIRDQHNAEFHMIVRRWTALLNFSWAPMFQ